MPTLSLNSGKVVTDCLHSLGKLTPAAPALVQLISTLNEEDPSFAGISSIIEKDAVLAGNILRTVNSPLFPTSHRITSVRHSLAILGITRVRNLALGLSVIRFFSQGPRPRAWSQSSFNHHCLATGVMAQLLARDRKLENGEAAFVAGLLHAIGRLLLTITYPELGSTLLSLRRAHLHLSAREFEMEFVGMPIDELSAMVLERWRLPEQVIEAVLCGAKDWDQTEPTQLGKILHDAHVLVNARGVLSTVCAMSLLGDDPDLQHQRIKEMQGDLDEDFDQRFESMKKELGAK